jgi:hypothetical protein
MSSEHVEPGEGHSPAAWVSVIIMLIAISASTLALFIAQTWLFVAGVVLLVIGLLAGWVLAKAGFGVNGPRYSPKERK